MADWTAISNAVLATGQTLTQAVARALRDNVAAAFDGAENAPALNAQALLKAGGAVQTVSGTVLQSNTSPIVNFEGKRVLVLGVFVTGTTIEAAPVVIGITELNSRIVSAQWNASENQHSLTYVQISVFATNFGSEDTVDYEIYYIDLDQEVGAT